VSGVAFSRDGDLWLNSASGVYRIAQEQISNGAPDRDLTVEWHKFDYLDGLEGIPRSPVAPSAAVDQDGRLYLAIGTGLDWVDPLHLPKTSIPPQVWITEVRTYGRDIGLTATPLRLAPNPRDIEIGYAATSLLIPERVLFRYRLQGFDGNWVEAGT